MIFASICGGALRGAVLGVGALGLGLLTVRRKPRALPGAGISMAFGQRDSGCDYFDFAQRKPVWFAGARDSL